MAQTEASPRDLNARIRSRALRLRCPQCGGARIFRAYGRVREACPACGLRFRREQGSQTGPMYLTAAVNQLFAAGVIGAIWMGTDWGLVTSLLVGIPVVLVFCFAFLPWAQSIWVGVEYATDAVNREEWVEPR